MLNKFIFTKGILKRKSNLIAALSCAFPLFGSAFRLLGQFFVYSINIIQFQAFFHKCNKVYDSCKKLGIYLLHCSHGVQNFLYNLSLRHTPVIHSFIANKISNSTKYKQTFFVCLGVVVGSTVVLGSLVGFVSYKEGYEIRRKANIILLKAEVNDTRKYNWNNKRSPISVNYRVSVDLDNILVVSNAIDEADQINSMLVFSGQGISFLNDEKNSSIDLAIGASSFMPVLSFDGAQESVLLAGTLPSSYGEPLNEKGRPLRWDISYANASSSVNYVCLLSQNSGHNSSATDRILLTQAQLLFQFQSKSLYARASRYKDYIEKAAKKYRLSTDLVYAIIHNESNFAPVRISPRSAMGLMQLMPKTAGMDVHSFLYGHTTKLSAKELFDPETNITYGTAYLYLLLNRDLAEIKNKVSREYCAIASYNMGPNGFLRLFSKDRNKAIAIINNMTSQEVLIRLTTKFPIPETRNYVARVIKSRKAFVGF